MLNVGNLKYVTIPPVCIWGTLLNSKASVTKSNMESNISYGTHLAAAKIDKISSNAKAKNEERKLKKEEKKNTEYDKTLEDKVNKTTNNDKLEESSESNIDVTINNTFVDDSIKAVPPNSMTRVEENSFVQGPDFSSLPRGILIDSEPEPFTQNPILNMPPVINNNFISPVDILPYSGQIVETPLNPITQADADKLAKQLQSNSIK